MTLRVAVAGMLLLFLLSLSSLVFFLFFVDPAYLSMSGFLLFYASLCAWLWSVFFLLGHFAFGRATRTFVEMLSRRALLLALLATASVFFEHLNLFSLYLFVALVAVLAFAEYKLARR